MPKWREKNEEIGTLETNIKQLTNRVDKLYEENLNLKSQLLSEMDMPRKTPTPNPDTYTDQPKLPHVLLIGTSNVKGIKEDKLTYSAQITKCIAYTIEEAKSVVTNYDKTPDVVVLHVLTNDLKTSDPATCTNKLAELVHLIGF